MEGQEVQVGDGRERGQAGERAQVAVAVAEPADPGLPQDQDQRRRGGDEEIQPLDVREVHALIGQHQEDREDGRAEEPAAGPGAGQEAGARREIAEGEDGQQQDRDEHAVPYHP